MKSGQIMRIASSNTPSRDDDAIRLDALAAGIRSLRDCVVEGGDEIWQEVEDRLGQMLSCGVELIVNTAGRWISWRDLRQPETGSHAVHLLDELHAGGPYAGRVLMIREGSILALLDRPLRLDSDIAQVVCGAVDLALAFSDGRETLLRVTEELDVMRVLAGQILQASDPDEVLLRVTHETRRLLGSDICGAMMREGEDVVMRCCVGHFSADTAKLRMGAGVGVAGLVLAEGKPCIVPDYVHSREITSTFVPLARKEKVRSALAVPIVRRDAVIGVLEVWRRRPSKFSQADTDLLRSLADLVSIAIDNAELNASRERAVTELNAAHRDLAERFENVSQIADFHDKVARLLLDEDPLSSISRMTAETTDGSLIILNHSLGLEAACVGEGLSEADALTLIRKTIRRSDQVRDETAILQVDGRHIALHQIGTLAEPVGWVGWIGAVRPAEMLRLVLGYVAVASALHLLERRRIGRERSKTLEGILWDLLEGPRLARAAAIDRARELHISLKGQCRLVVISFGNLRTPSGADWSSGVFHDDLLDRLRLSELGRLAQLVGIRGTQARVICKPVEIDRLLGAISGSLAGLSGSTPGFELSVGVSGVCDEMLSLPASLREALVSLEVAQHRPRARIACYDELGVLGLLINLRERADLRRVSGHILGALLQETDQSRQTLLGTLRVFFQADCSQAETASRLRVHIKTIAYRLSKIGKLTGLDLSRHSDRVLADVAIKLLSLMDMDGPSGNAQDTSVSDRFAANGPFENRKLHDHV